MSTLLYALGRWSYRHPWRVLVAWLLLLGIAGGSAAVFMQGTDNSFSIPGTEAQEGIQLLDRSFPQASGTSAQLVIVADEGDVVTDDPYAGEIDDTVARLDDIDGVLAVTDPFDEMVTGLIADDESAAIVRLQFDGQATDVSAETKDELQQVADDLRETLPDGSQVAMGGDLFSQSVPALSIIEAVGVLIALFVLIVTFRSFAVAWFPLVSALIGVGLAIALIYVSTAFASISSTTPMLAIMLGLAVGIDYALFIVARHQDQVRAGVEPEESAARATGTAGSAVVFAGVTVLIALVGLGFAGIPFLTTMGIAAAVAVAIAVVVAVTLTPALLGFAKGRVAGWGHARPRRGLALPLRRRRAVKEATDAVPAKRTNRWVMLVTRHPIITTIAVVVTLGVMAIPAASLALALPNAGQQPESSQARQAYDLTAEHFGPGSNGPLIMTGTIVTSTDPLGLMADLADEIEKVPGVEEIALATPNETADTGLIQIVPETAPDDPATADLVRDLRELAPELEEEYGVALKVTGFTAVGIDISDRLGAALLPFGIFVVGLSLVLLMIVFRSIWVPIKAALGYLLSVLAAFGVVAAVFEWGWGAELLHVDRTGPVISFMPIILMGVLFGLAMDYEVFLVSRMREDYVHARRAGHQTRGARDTAIGAVRSGFTASARVVTAAAVIMFAVFAAFVPEGDASIKPIALGLAVGIAVDAFLVRMTLVPAVMALLGEKAWWMPRWLERALPHFDIEGEAVERELALAAWPEPDTTAAVVGEGLAVRADGGAAGDIVLFDGATFRVEPGGTLLVTGEPRAVRAFGLAVAGRLEPSDGLLRVAGHLLPGRAAWVRAHVGVALLADADDPVRELRRALGGRTSLVVIDGVDALDPAERDQAAALLRDAQAALRARSDAGARAHLTVVATAKSEGPAISLFSDARRPGRELARAAGGRGIRFFHHRGERMTLSIERARTRRPVTWLTLIGVLLLPVVIGGILVAALYNPTERLDSLNAAIVNEDEPVTIDDQLVPLGRQLTAGLVEGADDQPSNLTWTISNADDAAAGLADGTYAAVITIPENFSAAATSTRPGETPEQATIEVTTPPDSLIVDDAITAQVTAAAASVMGEQLSQVYLENVFLGFTTLGDQLGEAASGAHSLADGATQAADGATQLADGMPQLADGASGLASGAGELQGGLGQIAGGIGASADGADDLAAGVNAGATTLEQTGIVPDQLMQAADGAAASTAAAADSADETVAALQTLYGECLAEDPTNCAALLDALTLAGTTSAILDGNDTPQNPGAVPLTSGTAAGLKKFDQEATAEFAKRFREIGAGATKLGAGLDQLASATAQSADGAGELSSGASQLSDGISQAGTGATSLADGVTQLADGTSSLADGLDQASAALPSYTDSEATSLAEVVANPVGADGVGTSLFGASAIPLLSTLALWFGGLATFIALQAVSRRALTAREPSALLALRGFAPAAALGAAQGVLVAAIVQLAASYDWGQWWVFAGVSVVAGIAFAAVNQALVAVFGGAGRWISALIGVLAVATGVVSTVPGVLSSVAALMPTSPAYNGMLAALTESGGVGAAIVGLAVWAVLAFVATVLAVARRRTTSARAVLHAAPAPA